MFDRLAELRWVQCRSWNPKRKVYKIKADGFLKDRFEQIGIVLKFPRQLPMPDKRSIIIRDVVRGKNGKPKRDKNLEEQKD